jgi:glycopeptide antibiotics resistance protein
MAQNVTKLTRFYWFLFYLLWVICLTILPFMYVWNFIRRERFNQ